MTPVVTPGVKDHAGSWAFTLRPVLPVVGTAPAEKFVPAENRGVLGDLLELAALSEHIAGLDGLAQGVLDGGDDDVVQVHVLPDGLELVVKHWSSVMAEMEPDSLR